MKTELIILSILIVFSAVTAFDFVTYILKSAPKRSYFTKRIWLIGAVFAAALVYWAMNGYKFI